MFFTLQYAKSGEKNSMMCRQCEAEITTREYVHEICPNMSNLSPMSVRIQNEVHAIHRKRRHDIICTIILVFQLF